MRREAEEGKRRGRGAVLAGLLFFNVKSDLEKFGVVEFQVGEGVPDYRGNCRGI